VTVAPPLRHTQGAQGQKFRGSMDPPRTL